MYNYYKITIFVPCGTFVANILPKVSESYGKHYTEVLHYYLVLQYYSSIAILQYYRSIT